MAFLNITFPSGNKLCLFNLNSIQWHSQNNLRFFLIPKQRVQKKSHHHNTKSLLFHKWFNLWRQKGVKVDFLVSRGESSFFSWWWMGSRKWGKWRSWALSSLLCQRDVMSDLAKGPPTLKGTTKEWGGETNHYRKCWCSYVGKQKYVKRRREIRQTGALF